jgi:hypothetical protein
MPSFADIFDSVKKIFRKKRKKTSPKKKRRKTAPRSKRAKPSPKRKRTKTPLKRKRSKSAGAARKRPVSKAGRKSVKPRSASREKPVGEITHYFNRIHVAVLKLSHGPLKVGDRIRIKGGKRDFTQQVRSLQIESVDVKSGRRGDLVGLKVAGAARAGDKVFKVAGTK